MYWRSWDKELTALNDLAQVKDRPSLKGAFKPIINGEHL
jgi:hypothetical protein